MRLAIVGAGTAGLAAAHSLRDTDAQVTVFEKSRGVSGRAATRWRDVAGPDGMLARWRYDHGAQYLSPDADSRAAAYVREHLGEGLVDMDGAVWPFDDAGTLRPDDARQDPGPRWTYPDGIAGLGRRLCEGMPDLDLRTQTRVLGLSRDADGWAVETDDGARDDGFDVVLLTAPAPQAAEIVRVGGTHDALAEALGAVAYRSQFTVVWGFGREIERPAEVYALVNRQVGAANSGGHAVAWLAVESDKRGRAPEGASILLAQMSDAWTHAHYDDAKRDVVAAASEAVTGLWGPLRDPLWTDTQRWRYSLPNGPLDASARTTAEADGLFVAGDATAGKGRVHLALEEGLAAADRVRERVERRG